MASLYILKLEKFPLKGVLAFEFFYLTVF